MPSKFSLAGKLQKGEFKSQSFRFWLCRDSNSLHCFIIARLGQITWPSASSLLPLISWLKALGFHTLAQSLPAVTPQAAYYYTIMWENLYLQFVYWHRKWKADWSAQMSHIPENVSSWTWYSQSPKHLESPNSTYTASKLRCRRGLWRNADGPIFRRFQREQVLSLLDFKEECNSWWLHHQQILIFDLHEHLKNTICS